MGLLEKALMFKNQHLLSKVDDYILNSVIKNSYYSSNQLYDNLSQDNNIFKDISGEGYKKKYLIDIISSVEKSYDSYLNDQENKNQNYLKWIQDFISTIKSSTNKIGR